MTDNAALVNDVTTMLKNIGHDVIGTPRSAQEAMRTMKKAKPDLVIVDIDVDDASGLKVSRRILTEWAVPIVLLVEPKDEMLARDERASGALAYAIRPIEQEILRQTIEVAVSRFEELTVLRKEAKDVKDALEGRKVVEKAKTILMRRFEITEAEAFQRLKQEAESQGKKLKEVADAVVVVDKML